jgi:D-alanyl-D-alanine carboxypeptidase/D-alanyl-D-alanine-endopeptidase (penicillin-binding protein 4)
VLALPVLAVLASGFARAQAPTRPAAPLPAQVPPGKPAPVPLGKPAPTLPASSGAANGKAALSAVAPSLVLAPTGTPPEGAEARRAWLRERLDELLTAPAFAGARLGALVVDFETGKPLYARGEKLALNAASNVKLVTSAAALSRLGPEYRWKTVVYGSARPGGRWLGAGGELDGDLVLRGTGDPALVTQDLGELASEVAAHGIRRVKGALVVDATFFEGGAMGPAYDQKDESAAFRAPSSAASLNGNAVQITVLPGLAAGAPARVVIEPPSPYFVTQGRITTASDGPGVPAIETEDADGKQTRIVLGGRVRLGSEPRVFLRRVVHPDLYLGHTFREVCKRRGIGIDKPLRFEAAPEGMRPLAAHESPPLGVVIHDLNKRSSNFAAEQVLRTLGAEVGGKPGTWQKGLQAVAGYLEGLGLPRTSYRMDNGAGLYDSNRFTAEQIVAVLRAALRDFRIASEYAASLSIAGTDGTLSTRMAGTAAARFVRGKTGTLATASALSGIAGAPGQKPLLFSLLTNDVAAPADARAAQDRLAELLVLYLEPRALAQPARP